MESFNPGGLPAAHDTSKDILLESFGAATPFDWDAGYDVNAEMRKVLGDGFVMPVKRQDESGSCGGQATALRHQKKEALATGTFEESSAKDVISQTFVLDGSGVMLGSRMRDNLALATSKGVCRESLLPSYPSKGRVTDAFMNRPQDLTPDTRADALRRKGEGYGFVKDVRSIDVIARAAQLNGGLQMLFRGENNGSWRTDEPKVTERPEWAHFQDFSHTEVRHGKRGIWFDQSVTGWPSKQWFSEDWFRSGFVLEAGTLIMPGVPVPERYEFTRDLALGSAGIDVRILQAYLNAHGNPVAASGPGSPGKETTSFGPLTRAALAAFQARNGISPAAGFFGPITRRFVNSSQ